MGHCECSQILSLRIDKTANVGIDAAGLAFVLKAWRLGVFGSLAFQLIAQKTAVVRVAVFRIERVNGSSDCINPPKLTLHSDFPQAYEAAPQWLRAVRLDRPRVRALPIPVPHLPACVPVCLSHPLSPHVLPGS
jgi:hypothetical protein